MLRSFPFLFGVERIGLAYAASTIYLQFQVSCSTVTLWLINLLMSSFKTHLIFDIRLTSDGTVVGIHRPGGCLIPPSWDNANKAFILGHLFHEVTPTATFLTWKIQAVKSRSYSTVHSSVGRVNLPVCPCRPLSWDSPPRRSAAEHPAQQPKFSESY
jgi:hypothetical protein